MQSYFFLYDFSEFLLFSILIFKILSDNNSLSLLLETIYIFYKGPALSIFYWNTNFDCLYTFWLVNFELDNNYIDLLVEVDGGIFLSILD